MSTATFQDTFRQDLPRDIRRQETTRLFAEAAQATGIERDRLVEEIILVNTSVARTIAKRYANRGVALEDLESVAYLALVRAAQKFDGDKGEDFLVYAVPTIRGEIKRHFRDHGWVVRPPRRVQELQADVVRVRESRDGEADAAEIADELGVGVADVNEALAAKGCFTPASLDAPARAGDTESATLGELLPTLDEDLARAETRAVLGSALARLTDREQTVVQMRFVDDLTQAEIGEHIGVTQMQVSRILKQVLNKLRTALAEADVVAA
ncbi:sigma-70 family RNA polymerase sigma factor [Nocardioides sp. DS6]|uniref:Sigma-70 family RNA polymerase sigma factor n=1 Tax=Nocardioides eburneus TaxID=3231482 RepID=A0ABV3SV38_9ACTN